MDDLERAIDRALAAEERFNDPLSGEERDDALGELFEALGDLRYARDKRDEARLKKALG